MLNRQVQLLIHPSFLLSVTLLLLNDFLWKQEYQNWFTGKLSDCAGLFAFTLFFSSFFYHRRVIVCFSVAVFFIWWKSPLSQPVIDFANQVHLYYYRKVDYSDLFALPFVFLTLFLKPRRISLTTIRRLAIIVVSAISVFAFTATSYYKKFSIRPDLGTTIEYYKSYNTPLTQEEILDKLDRLNIRYVIDSFTVAPLRYYGGSILINTKDSSGSRQIIFDPRNKDSSVFFRIDEMPYIGIINLNAGEIILPQVRIRTYRNNKTNTIILEAINPGANYYNEYLKYPERTKKRLQRIIESELIKKLL